MPVGKSRRDNKERQSWVGPLAFGFFSIVLALIPIFLALVPERFGSLARGLKPCELRSRILAALIQARVVSQLVWNAFIRPYEIDVGFAFSVAMFNALFDLGCVYLSLYNSVPFNQDLKAKVGLGFFILGTIMERGSEIQRALFKARKDGEGKPYTYGMFRFLVHANYTGYILWRLGLVMVSGGLFPYSLIVIVMLASNFTRDMREQRERNSKKYGTVFDRYWDRTTKLVPFVY